MTAHIFSLDLLIFFPDCKTFDSITHSALTPTQWLSDLAFYSRDVKYTVSVCPPFLFVCFIFRSGRLVLLPNAFCAWICWNTVVTVSLPFARNTLIPTRSLHVVNACRHNDYLQVTNNAIESIAEGCRRKHISEWIHKSSSGKATRKKWHAALVKMLMCQTVLKNEAWRDVFTSAKDTLKKKYPQQSAHIEKDIMKYLKKSPVEDFLKAEAYKWLKSLADNPPDAPSWFPHLAVEVAHKAFRLHGKIGTFALFLRRPARLKFLKDISPHVEGLPWLIILL